MTEIPLDTYVDSSFRTSPSPTAVNYMADVERSRGWRRVGRHYLLLLWKNVVLAKRSPVRTVLEITLPVFFGFLLLAIRHIVKSDNFPNNTIYPAFPVTTYPNLTGTYSWFGYAPNTTFTRNIMGRVGSNLGAPYPLNATPYPTEEDMVRDIRNNTDAGCLFGIFFSNLELDSNITYKIRLPATLRTSGAGGIFSGDHDWRTNLLYPIFPTIGPRYPKKLTGGSPSYFEEGFLGIQRAVDMEILSELNSTFNASAYDISLQRYPFPPYKADNFVFVIQLWFPFLLVMSYIFAAINTVKNIVHEKEKGLKIAMTIMGLNSWIHWASWFTRTLIFLVIADILIAICYIVKIPLSSGGSSSVIGESDIFLVFFFLLSYSITSICFMFLISTLFDKANSSAAGTGAIWFLSYLPYLFIQPQYESLSKGAKFGTCILHNIALSLGAQLIGMFEGKGTGLQWSMFNEPVSVDDDFTMANVITMLYIDAIIYLVLALYIENIWPGQYGIPKGVLYPFKLSYWRGSTPRRAAPFVNQLEENGAINKAFEKEPQDKQLGVQLIDVSKTYTFPLQNRPPVHAVNNMTMNIYNGQLTALLGHNGAGKSTTISMITGLIPPTSGQIVVNGYDLSTSMDEVRNILGLCPQYNILFDQLTVREHLRLFATLKGHPSNDIDHEIQQMVETLMLTDKIDTLSSALSGGMKRKLSVGIALIANSKVVILDEPTSGMDPAARRSTWDMLQRFRRDRTIVFTTHFMDEADVLGDRIAIMGNGHVRCCGSPFFLKTSYGVGYHLILSKDAHSDAQQIFHLVQRHIPSSRLESAISAECKILLPHETTPKFPELFDDLEANKDDLQIFSIGLSETTIEEVFMKIVEQDEPDEIVTTNSHGNGITTYETAGPESVMGPTIIVENQLSIFDIQVTKNVGVTLIFQQFMALLQKHILNSLRNYLVLFASVLPILFVVMSLIITQQIPEPGDSPSLLISLDRYKPTNVPFTYDTANPDIVAFMDSYKSAFGTAKKSVKFLDLTMNETRLCQEGKPTDIYSYLGCIGERSLTDYSDNYLIGAQVTSIPGSDVLNLTGLFNGQPYHIPPLTLNYFTNGLLKQYLPNNQKNMTINVINHPLPRSFEEELNDFQSKEFFGSRLASSIVFGFSFMMASFAVFVIKERVTKAKHLQFLSGAGGLNFWFSTFAWDFFHYLICTLLIMAVWGIFSHAKSLEQNLSYFLGTERLGISFLLFLLYGCAQIPMTYLMTYLFQIPASGFAWITIINIVTSQATILAVNIISIPQLDLLSTARALEWTFLIIFPNFALGQGLNDIYKNAVYNDLCAPFVDLCAFIPNPCCKDNCGDNCIDYTSNYMSWVSPGVGRFAVFMAIQSVLFFGIIFGMEYRFFSLIKQSIKRCLNPSANNYHTLNDHNQNLTTDNTIGNIVQTTDTLSFNHGNEDEDVAMETRRIQNTSNEVLMETDLLVLNQVSKLYNGTFRAVDQISVGVPRGECFGLLGVNGAGKTTTFKMITGDELIDHGTILIDRLQLNTNMRRAQRRMGYCPQFDALIDLLTGEETLYMFARLRGVQEHLIPTIADALIDLLNLRKHAKKPVYAYSGGNKRKLSAAVSLIGDPAIVFLDEPTTGMDPKARRHFWNAIAQFRDHGKPIILTSHSMEECEALCTRLAIMVNGKFKCIGSIQHLKSKFGAGYTLLAKMKEINQDTINKFFNSIKKSFPNSQMQESYEGYVHIHVNEPRMSLGALFRIIESSKDKYSIENYTVSQTTLEQVFLNFARTQLDPDELRRRMRSDISCKDRFLGCLCCSCQGSD